MLHIIGLIFKFIGIVLLVVLGIVVLLLCTVLFVPIKYKVKADYPGNFDDCAAQGEVSWLLKLIRAEFEFVEKNFRWQVRAAWMHFGSDVEAKKESEATETKAVESKKEEPESEESKAEESKLEKTKAEETKIVEPEIAETKAKEKDESEPETKRKVHIWDKIKQGFQDIIEKIKCTFQSIYARMKQGLEWKEMIEVFLYDKVHRAAFFKVKKELVWLKRLIVLKEGRLDLHFGFEDPSLTGKVLAALSLIYPFLGDNMNIQPEFEEVCLEGKVSLKGHVRLIHLLILAIRLVSDRNVRITFKDILKLKDELI